VAFSPDGRRLASAGYERIVRLWDTTTGREVLKLGGHTDIVGRVLFSPDGQRLASASADGTVRVWDASPFNNSADPRIRTLRGPEGEFYGLAFSPDGRLLASASTDRSIKLWDAQTGQEVPAFHGHKEAVLCLTFSPDGQRLLSGSMDRTVKLWDVRTRELLRSFEEGFKVMVRSVAFRPDGKAFAAGSHHMLQLWDLRGRRLLNEEADPEFVNCVTFSRDGKYLATVGHTRTAKVWDVTDVARAQVVSSFPWHQTHVFCVAFHPEGKYLASGDSDSKVEIWDPVTGRPIKTLSRQHTDFVSTVAFSRDGRFLATASWKEVIVWDANSFEKLKTLDRLAGKIWSVAFSPDGKRLAAAGGYKGEGEIKIWDATLWDRSVVNSP
jgi:WD40 repeat protein